MPASIDNAEEVAIGIFKDSEIVIGVVGLRMAYSSYLEQTLNLSISVVRIEVKMQPVSAHEPFRNPIQGYIRVSSLGVPKDHPAALRRLSGNVMKCLLPER